jgi:hypothetical protein
LSAVFSENVGANEAVVLGPGPARFGPAPLFSEYTFQLDRPFFYNPSAGNLLMDVRNFFGGNGSMMGSVNAANHFGDSTSRVGANDVMAIAGGTHTDGLITLFTVTPVPEPASALVFLAGGCLLAWRWRRRR